MSFAPGSPYRPLRDGLRAAGRYLDDNARRLSALLMTDEGIVVTLAAPDIHDAGEALLLTHDDLQGLITQARTARGTGYGIRSPDPLFPTGYEDFLRALGAVCAGLGWSRIRLVRLGTGAVLRYSVGTQRAEMPLAEKDIEDVLNHAFNQRGRSTP